MTKNNRIHEAKFFSALTVIAVLFLSLVLLMVGTGILITGSKEQKLSECWVLFS